VLAAAPSPSLQSFGAARAISAYDCPRPHCRGGAVQPIVAASLSGSALRVSGASSSFATSALLAPNLALDTGANHRPRRPLHQLRRSVTAPALRRSCRRSPRLTGAGNGGNYSGVTFVPYDNLRLRAGIATSNERLDRFHFGCPAPTGPLALTYDASQSQSLLGGMSLDISSALGLDVNAIASQRSGMPLGLANPNISQHSSTGALRRCGACRCRQGLGHHRLLQRRHDATGLARPVSPAAAGCCMNNPIPSPSPSMACSAIDALGVAFSRAAPSWPHLLQPDLGRRHAAGDRASAPLTHVQEPISSWAM